VAIALAAVAVGGVLLGATGTLTASGDNSNTQTAKLYELQRDFHAAATLRDPNDLDERVADMLTLWTEDGTLSLGPNTFSGKGEPGTASCESGSGTICDFFTNVAPPFQNPWVSLSPSYRTTIEVSSKTAELDFECLYFDENWVRTLGLDVDASATKVGNDWLLSEAVVTPIPPTTIPHP
jgi:hypothetical protein